MNPTTYATLPALGHEWWLALLRGIALLVIGVLLLTATGITLFMLVVFLGVYWLIGGIFDLVGIFLDRTQWGWKLFTGIIGVLAGLMVVRHPLWATILVPTTLAVVLATIGLAIGVVSLFRAITGAGWGTAIVGVISLLLGVILLLHPYFSALVIVYAAAVWAIVGGVATIAWAFWLRSIGHQTMRPTRVT